MSRGLANLELVRHPTRAMSFAYRKGKFVGIVPAVRPRVITSGDLAWRERRHARVRRKMARQWRETEARFGALLRSPYEPLRIEAWDLVKDEKRG